jgi:hypothetical protein
LKPGRTKAIGRNEKSLDIEKKKYPNMKKD